MTPEAALPGATSGERRRAATGSAVAPVRVWDPDGPTGGAIAAPLWDALRDAVLWAQAEWERVVEHASNMDEVTAHLAQVCTAIRQQASGQNPDLAALPRNPRHVVSSGSSASPFSTGRRRCPPSTAASCCTCSSRWSR